MMRKPRIWVRTCRMSMRFMIAPRRGASSLTSALPAPASTADLSRQEEHGHERVDRQRLGQRGDDDHGELDACGGFGLTADRLHGALTDQAETDARADRGDADAERETESQRCLEMHGPLLG